MKNIFYLLLIILAATACDRNTSNTDQSSQDQLPAATQTGANTFGCKVNGIVFVPNKAIGTTVIEKPLWVSGYYSYTENYSNKITGWRGHDVRNVLYIDVYIYKLAYIGVGEYILGSAPFYDDNPPFSSYIKCRAVSPSTKEYKIYGSYDNSGKIHISRKEANNNVFSGIFSGTLEDLAGSGETINISEGRFDINKVTLP